ncbi:uncharacterized protein LOC127288266 [Leptopilina boulardi]|uniref:uncharacterized protein LOC127288266 n=1 Tax=Leptopilina boulardi TaxID=63433 RepID=UPI0021F5EDA6|nr:uncharacterized protein LOC127288266 [Leptopilina boulardi]
MNRERRNKRVLDADYDPKDVHPTTRWRWGKKLNVHLQKNIKIDLETSTLDNQMNVSEREITASSKSYVDELNVNMSPSANSINNCSLEYEMTSNTMQERQRFVLSSSSDTSDNDWNDYKDCNNCSLDFQMASDVPFEMTTSLEQECEIRKYAFKNTLQKQQGFVSSSSSDTSDNDWSDYEDCEDGYESDECVIETESATMQYKKMSHAIMFPKAQLTTRDVSLMIMAYSIRFHCTYEARDALFEMCKQFAGDEFQNWNTSKFVMNQLYDPPDEVITLCFICEKCFKTLMPPISKKKFKNCNIKCTCGLDYNLTTESSNYVIAVDLKYQLEVLFKDEEIKTGLLKNIRDIMLRKNDSGKINDVYDGLLYKKLQRKYPENDFITLNFNTDGAPLCNSAKKSFWPLQVTVQELPPKLRFKYPILAGLSINKKEPTWKFMNSYMQLFVNQMELLAEKGIQITDENGMSLTLKVLPLYSSVDSVARPILQNRLQYNAYYGCSWCYEKGVYDSRAIRYPVKENDAKLRTVKSHKKDCKDVEKFKKPTIRGIKGTSVLLSLLTFDIVWGFPVDYLHAVLLGVVKYIFNIWIEANIITTGNLRKLNEKLLQMTPPQEIHRQPRPINEKAKWKASEWRSFLLFYSVICLKDLIPAEVLNHYALLVESIFILLKDSISEEELRICEEKLLIFVAKLQEMFGNSVMTFNIHSLLHLVESVRRTGPLWTTSTFPFEGAIFYLKQAVTGPKGVFDQIAKRTLLKLSFDYTLKKLATSEKCLNFCGNIFSHSKCKNAVKQSNEIVLLDTLGENEKNEKLFKRCIYKSTMFHSTKYNRTTKTNDTFVVLMSNEIGEITEFQLINGNTFILLNLFSEISDNAIPVSHIKRIQRTTLVVKVPLELIQEKLMYMKVDNTFYVSKLPNTIEIQ